MWNDIRFAVRRLLKDKGFTITGTAILALGIGASTGIFTLIHAVMIKSLPVADPQRIVRIGDGDNCCVLGGLQDRYSIYSYSLYSYLRSHTPEFEDMSAFQAGIGKVGVRKEGAPAADPFVDQFVSGNYFSLFGIRPFTGRLIQPADDVRGAAPVAVMSYRVWRERYSSDPSVIGAAFDIDGAPYTIVGITPPGFYGAALRPDPPDFWMPLAMEPVALGKNALLDQKTAHWLYVFGRIKPGTPLPPVEAELTTELRQWLLENEAANDRDRQNIAKMHITLAPGGAGVASLKENYDRDLRLLLGITALVLLIACANLANLQLARGASAAAQTSIRVALGAPRSALIRQVLVEGAILALLGGALGLFVAMETADLLIRLAFHSATFVPIETTPAAPVLGFALLLSLITALVFGTAPAWSASKADPAVALRGAGRSIGGRSTASQKTLVILQAALSLVLLAGAGLMVQTLRNLSAQQFGFRMEGNVVVNVNAAVSGYSPEKIASVYAEIERRARQVSGVRNATLMLYSPMSGDNWQMGATLEDRPQQRVSPSWDRVSPGLFDTIGAHILRGRGFDQRDTPDSVHVAVVNESFAKTYFPNEDPIGKRFGLGGFAHRGDYTIVGVVNTIRFRNPRVPGRPMFFLPLLQMSKSEWSEGFKASSNLIHSVILRVDRPGPNMASEIQRAFGSIDPRLTVLNVTSTSEMLGELLAHEQTIGVLAQIFGVLALILASVGLYGLTAYSVARRTNEIGVRAALGATRAHVVRLILSDALMQAGIGLAAGIPAALAAGRLLAGQVYGVKTWDPLILGAAVALLGICAAVAGIIPAIRASSVDPVRALRVDN
jgi:predicted permease